MEHTHILVVDDEIQIQRLLKTTFEVRGYKVTLAATGREALEAITALHPDLVLLDLGLPELDGIEVTRRIRAWSSVPIIVLSVRDQEQDKIQALNEGADDYVTKPFGTGELIARVQVALRHAARANTTQQPVLVAGDLRIDLEHHLVTRRDEDVHLTPTEYELLKTLAQHSGKVLTHTMVMRAVWGTQQHDAAKLRVFINQLRRKIEDDAAQPRYIVTELSVGYRFQGDQEE